MAKLTGRFAAVCLVSLLGVHCGGDSNGGAAQATGGSGGASAPECVSGDTRACLGAGQCDGAQECNAKGTGWTKCDCGSESGTGGAGEGATGNGGGSAATGGTGEGATTGNGGTGQGATTGSGATGSGASGSGAADGVGGVSGSGAADGVGGVSGSGAADGVGGGAVDCEDRVTTFVPTTPTVYVLVDRSGSIYDLQQWVPLRDAILPVIQAAQARVRFGFGTFTGTQEACTGLSDSGSTGLNNYDSIAAHYHALPTIPSPGQETPLAFAHSQVADLIAADEDARAARAIFLLTADDDADFCNNPAPECGNDATIAVMQDAAAANINTFTFALDSESIQNAPWLHYWAQAGQGQKPNWPLAQNVTQYNGQLYDACHTFSDWLSYRDASGHAEYYPAGDYSPEGGTAQATIATSSSALASAMADKLDSLQRCTFELQNGTEVKAGSESQGEVFVNEVNVPGAQWRMNSTTELELLGAACETWKGDDQAEFSAHFPCDALE